jgi:hypothetical protein
MTFGIGAKYRGCTDPRAACHDDATSSWTQRNAAPPPRAIADAAIRGYENMGFTRFRTAVLLDADRWTVPTDLATMAAAITLDRARRWT